MSFDSTWPSHPRRYIFELDAMGKLCDKMQLAVIRGMYLQKCQQPEYASTAMCGKLPLWVKMLEEELAAVEEGHTVGGGCLRGLGSRHCLAASGAAP